MTAMIEQQIESEAAAIDIFSKQIPWTVASDIGSVESVIAKQMSALSVEAREKAYMDMHGIPNPLDDSPEAIQRGLVELQEEIEKITHKDAYNQALKMDRQYVEDAEFRIMFLRTEEMNAKLAALRLVRHFQLKLDLFGSDNLARTITQDDLDKDDMEALYGGRGRLLKSKDSGGRSMSLFLVGQPYATRAMLRSLFYRVVSNPQPYLPGVVLIVYGLRQQAYEEVMKEKSWKLPKAAECLPARIVAVHLCQDRSIYSSFFAYAMMAFNAFTRIRIRTHCGTHNEVLSRLRGHGINPDTIPVNEEGQLTDLEDYRKNLVLRRTRERMRHPRRTRIYVPSVFDVLFGKGSPCQSHPGNKRLRSLVLQKQKEYEKSGRGEKHQVSQDIVDSIIGDTGMFLKFDGDSWIIVDNDAACDKVSMAFRSLRKSGDRPHH